MRILHIEDQPADSEIVQEKLRREGLAPEIHRVETLDEFTRALQHGTYSLIISDYTLPAMDALDALRLARQQRPEIPFIFLSGTLGEEQAVDCLKLGATDYVLKQRMTRLVPAVRRALQEAREHARRKQAEAELRQSEAKFRALFDHSPDAVFLTIPDGRITAANSAACAMFGMTEAEIIQAGRAGLADPADSRHALALAGRTRTGQMQAELNFIRKNGERFTAEARSVLLGGELLQSFVILRDITERKRAEASAAELKRRLDAALLAGEIATFDWNIPEDRIWGDANLSRLFGIPLDAGNFAPLPAFINAIHPEDRASVTERIKRTIETGAPYEAEYRILTGDQTRWVIARGTAERDQTGRVVRFAGVLVDITERKRAEALLRAALRNVELERSRLAAVLEALPVGVAIADATGKVTQFNAALNRIWGTPLVARNIADYSRWRARWVDTGQPLAPEDWAMARTLTTGQVVPGDIVEI
ncbi:MAG TPA: PAS domain S-box protein, partial [Bacillota bacterium]|nr:PAS domain S-box protein [Bacillota bacterium]